jgi:hypothetical protein
MIFFSLFFLLTLNAQEEPIRLSMELELGSQREIVTAANSKVFIDGELSSDQLDASVYQVALIDTLYRPTFSFSKQLSENYANPKLSEADQENLIELFVKITEEKLKSLTYHIIFDDQSREAVEIINDSIYDASIDEQIVSTSAQFTDFMADDSVEKKEFNANLSTYLQKSKKSILDELLTDFNDLMSPYRFPRDGESKDSVMVNDISFFSQVANNAVSAEITINTALEGNTISVNSSLDYNKESFIKVAKKANAAFQGLEAKDINIIERNSFESDLMSKWLNKFTSERIISIPGIKVVYVNTYTFYE